MIGFEEEQIRRLFKTARQLDESQAPGFQATLAGARRRAVARNYRRVLAAVTVMVVFAILSLLVIERTKNEAELPSSRAVLYWESPTEAYLSAPGEGVLRLVAIGQANGADRSRR